MRLLIFGRNGQVATELLRHGGAHELTPLGRGMVELSDPDACAAAVEASDCDAVINAAAYTAVDRAEEEEDVAHVINAEAPGAMARAAAKRAVPFLHISTDYVFDGSGERPWRPDDAAAPLSAYGRTKLAGEAAVQAAGGTYAILRTAWVFSAHGANFVKTMLRLSESRDRLSVVDDQIGGPTPAGAIADALLAMAPALAADPAKLGTYHFSGSPEVSWKIFACEIFARGGREVAVESITTTDYPTPATRPANSRLDCSDIGRVFGIARPDWKARLDGVLADLGATRGPRRSSAVTSMDAGKPRQGQESDT